MARRGWLGVWFLLVAGTMIGCGGATDDVAGAPGTPGSTAARKGVVFVGFDASEPLVDAMRQGKIQGLVVQNPIRMGELSVKTMVKHLEKQPVEPKVSTGEVLVTPENMNDPEIAKLIHPPQVENTSGASLSGAKSKKWRVIVIPKGTTHEFWKTLHAGTLKAADELGNVDVIWQGPQKEDDRVQQIQLVQNAIAAGVDGIVLAPLDARALVDPVEAAVAKGIPVVIFDSALESTKMVSYVATNNYNGGVLAGAPDGRALEGPGKGHPAPLCGRLGEHRATREGLHRHARQRLSRHLVAVGHGIRRPDLRLRSAKGPEPGDALPGTGRRDLLRQRVEYIRDVAGPRWSGHAGRTAMICRDARLPCYWK